LPGLSEFEAEAGVVGDNIRHPGRLLDRKAWKAGHRMKNGLYSVNMRGLDGVDWPPGGVVILRDGVLMGGGPYTYFTGSYSFKDGIFKGEFVLNQHTPAPAGHLFFGAKDVGMGVSGSYGDDQAELTGTALVGKRSTGVRVTLRKLAAA
jgi:hypothetical protein